MLHSYNLRENISSIFYNSEVPAYENLAEMFHQYHMDGKFNHTLVYSYAERLSTKMERELISLCIS